MRAFVLSTLLAALAGCASTPSPLAEQPVQLQPTYSRPAWLAGLLTGQAATSTGAPDERAAACAVELLAFAVRACADGTPALDTAKIVTGMGGQPFPGANVVMHDVRVLAGAPAQAWLERTSSQPLEQLQPLGSGEAIAAVGLATTLTPAPLQTALTLTLDGSELRLLLTAANGDLMVLSQSLPAAGDTAVLVAPAAFGDGTGFALAVRRQAVATAAAREAALGSVRNTTPAAPAPATEGSSLLRQQVALARAAVGENNRRPALLAVARRLRLASLENLILGADADSLATIARQLPTTLEATPVSELDWVVERSIWSAIAAILQRDAATASFRGCLLRELGAVTYDPTALELLLEAHDADESFRNGLRDENLLALGDRSAASRMRANDWLSARGLSVPDYDPLGTPESRRAALRAHAAAPPAPTVSPSGAR